MAARKKQQVLLRIDPKIHEKMKIIADYNKRTMSLQAEYLMDQCIKEFEHQNGTIPLVSINNNVSGNQYNTISGA